MKMGTVSEYVLRDVLKKRYAVASKEEAKLHASAMEYINQMSNPGDWGIILILRLMLPKVIFMRLS